MSDDDFFDDVVVPFWVANGEPEPPLVSARLYLDRAGDGGDRFEQAWRHWREVAAARLTPLLGAEPPEPFVDDDRRCGRIDESGQATAWQLGCDVDRFGDDAYAVLTAYAGVGADRGRLDEVVEAVLDVLREGAAGADPLYGELTVDGPARMHRTALDVALGRSAEYSAGSGRAALRGYEWVTVCPAELAARIDPAVGGFVEVTDLAGGGRLLRATADIGGWTQDAARAVFVALAPVLPDGLPERKEGEDLSRVVFADAAEVRAGHVGALPIGPAPLPASGPELVAVLTEFVSEAMRRGWLTMEPMDESAPPEIRAVFPAEMGMGLTPEGQRRLAERLGL